MEANELRFHKSIIKSPMLASKHQNRILSISKNKIEKVMNRVHTWKASSQMEAHMTSSPVFMTPPGRCPDQDPFSPRPSSNSPLLSFFSFPHSPKLSSASRRPKKAFFKEPPPKNVFPLFSKRPLFLSQLLSYSLLSRSPSQLTPWPRSTAPAHVSCS